MPIFTPDPQLLRSTPHFCEPGSLSCSAPVIRARPLAAGEGERGLVPSTPVPAELLLTTTAAQAFANHALLSPDVDGQTGQLIRFHFSRPSHQLKDISNKSLISGDIPFP